MNDWAENRLKILTENQFIDEELRQILIYARSIPMEASFDYFKSILGENPQVTKFLEEWKDKESPKVVGAWQPKITAIGLMKEIADGFSGDDLENMLNYAHTLNAKELKSYIEGILGSSEKTGRLILLIQKENEKIQSQRANSENKKGSKNKKEKKKLVLEKIGNAANGISGREICECMATAHSLVTNCLRCGKIVCTYEGSEICPFCDTKLVILSEDASNESLLLAKARATTLQDYDKNSSQRTKVIDISTDFDYHDDIKNRWLTPEQRALAIKKQQELELMVEKQNRRVFTIDLEKNSILKEPVIGQQKVLKSEEPGISSVPELNFENPTLSKKPIFISTIQRKKKAPFLNLDRNRLLDDEIFA